MSRVKCHDPLWWPLISSRSLVELTVSMSVREPSAQPTAWGEKRRSLRVGLHAVLRLTSRRLFSLSAQAWRHTDPTVRERVTASEATGLRRMKATRVCANISAILA
jgi:hypothetical protein